MMVRKFTFISSFFVLMVFLLPQYTFAQNTAEIQDQIEQVRREREALLEEQKRLQADLEKVNREAQTIGTAVKSLDATRRKINADINVTKSRITTADLNIRSLENTVTEKEWQMNVHRQAIASTISALSQYDSRSVVLDILTSSGLSDAWRDRNQLHFLSSRLEGEIDSLRETREGLVKEKALKERTKEEQLKLESQLAGQRDVVAESQKAKEKLLAETKSVEAAYQKMLNDNIARQKQFESDLFRLESELKIALDPSLIPTSRPGVLAWPLDNVFITQSFGRTSASGRLYASGTHNGIDFRAAQGTPVKTVLSGVVEGQGNTDEQKGCGSYGRWVLIKHPNGLTSVYAHLSSSVVKTGQEVKTGEVIGFSGGQPGVFGSGYSTGPHLHLGLFASQGVSIRQFTTSRGCTQMFVPIADVKAYLDPAVYLPAI